MWLSSRVGSHLARTVGPVGDTIAVRTAAQRSALCLRVGPPDRFSAHANSVSRDIWACGDSDQSQFPGLLDDRCASQLSSTGRREDSCDEESTATDDCGGPAGAVSP